MRKSIEVFFLTRKGTALVLTRAAHRVKKLAEHAKAAQRTAISCKGASAAADILV